MASLDHPNIVRLYDFVEVDGHLVLVMERLFGGTVNSQGPLPPQTACAYVVAACAGLQYAHERGILHRDVKPQNLLLSAEGTLKVGDFGIAKLLNAKGMTLPGTVLGTPSYIAPEQINGDTLTPAVDVYAAGVVLYELLSGGELPYPRLGNPVAEFQQRIKHEPVPLRERAPYLPDRTGRDHRARPAPRSGRAVRLRRGAGAPRSQQAADVEWQAPATAPTPAGRRTDADRHRHRRRPARAGARTRGAHRHGRRGARGARRGRAAPGPGGDRQVAPARSGRAGGAAGRGADAAGSRRRDGARLPVRRRAPAARAGGARPRRREALRRRAAGGHGARVRGAGRGARSGTPSGSSRSATACTG